jgi:hypothetical protein
MSYEHLTPRERIHIERAHSQALYYAQRGFADACRIYAPHIPAVQRSLLSGMVGRFLVQYVIEELQHVIRGGSEGLPDAPIRDTATAVFDCFGDDAKGLTRVLALDDTESVSTPDTQHARISL